VAPDRVIEATVDQLAEAELRLLGLYSDEAARLIALPSGHRGLIASGWLLPTIWTGLTGWGQARCGPRWPGRPRAVRRGLCARPHTGAITLALLFGLFNLIFGIWMIVQGIELRRTGKTLDSALPEK
jgi:hypothetical protein